MISVRKPTGTLLLVWALLFSPTIHAENVYLISVSYLEEDASGGMADTGTRYGCRRKLGEECRDVYYISDRETGTYGGGPNKTQGIQFELVTGLKPVMSDGQLGIAGWSYLANLDSTGAITSGQRTIISENIDNNDSLDVLLGKRFDGKQIGIRVRLSDKNDAFTYERPEAAFTLAYGFFVDNKQFSSGHNGQSTIRDTMTVRTEFSTPQKDGQFDHVKYYVTVILDGYEANHSWPYHGKMTYIRRYEIDTAATLGGSFSNDMTYHSKYEKMVELNDGELFELLIPPDSPLIRNFGFEDTLIFIP